MARRCTPATLAVVLALTTATPAALADDAPAAVAGAAASAWDPVKATTGSFWTAVTSLFVTPDPFDYLPEQMPERDRHFLAVMDVAGYRLATIETGGGLLGSVTYRFEQQRAPSTGDLDRVRVGLAEHQARFSGPAASAERRAVRGLLAVSDAPGFRVAAVDVELLPWPEVSFHLTARDPIAGAAP